jgi:integrase
VIATGEDPKSHKYTQSWTTVKGTKKEAETRLAEMLHQIDTGSYIRPGKTTVGDFLQKWLGDYGRANLQPKSFERYQSIVNKHLIPALGDIKLLQLKPEHLQKHYVAQLGAGLSPSTVRYDHVVIHKALQTAIKWGVVPHNVADGVDIPRSRHREMQVWDKAEMSRFLEAVKTTPYYAMFYLALFTGMRRSELLALRWQDIDFSGGEVSVNRGLLQLEDGSFMFTEPKSAKSRRTIALPPSSLEVLQEHKSKIVSNRLMIDLPLKERDLIFSTIDGKPLRPNTVSRAWTILATRAGVKVIRFHDARHTHATLLLQAGVNIKVVQERLGHAGIQITLDTYCHVTPGMQKDAAIQFDKLFFPEI